MLVHTRKVGQQIQIGDNIVATVNAIGGNRVKIGVAAPRETVIGRGELSANSETNENQVDASECLSHQTITNRVA